MTTSKPKQAILYCRISDDANGAGTGVATQEADLRQHADKLGWGVGRVIVENDTSAFKRRKVTLPNGTTALRVVRPGWRSMLDDLAAGRADALLALDLDRAARDPRDLEDLIDAVEARVPRIPVESITGSLKLANDADVTMARIMVAVANKSSRDTARRVSRAMLRIAGEGRFTGGARRYGHNLDGTVNTEEAAELRKAADLILSGVGVAGLVKDLNRRGVPTARGGAWSHQSLRDMLLQPRIAGLMAYGGEILEGGASAMWEPIIDRGEWEAVRTLLKSPERRTTPGPAPKWLGTNLYRCGHASHEGDAMPTMMRSGTAGAKSYPVYRCSSSAHIARAAVPLDDFVSAVIIERLSRPDVADLLVPRVDVDVTALATEANKLRAGLTGLTDLVETGDISTADFRTRKARLVEKLAEVEATVSASCGTSPLVGLAGRTDAGEVWAGLDLARRRAVLDVLMTITVLPSGRRGRGFDPESVRIDWE